MKKKADPRHKKRVQSVKLLFEKSFRKDIKLKEGSVPLQVLSEKTKIDKLIKKFASNWPIDQISGIDLAILRLAIWEMMFENPRQPEKVIIDEAVEIAKEYGNESSAGFVNGVLGTIISRGNYISERSEAALFSKKKYQ